MMKTSFQVFPNRFASNIPQNFRKFFKYPWRSEVLLLVAKKNQYLSLVTPLAGACPCFLSIKQLG